MDVKLLQHVSKLAALTMTLFATSCAKTDGTDKIKQATCEAWLYIYVSPLDTPLTQRAALENNLSRRSFCE